MTQLSISQWCSFTNHIYATSSRWGKLGVEFISNLCNAFTESLFRGLQNLHPPVQIWVPPLVKNPLVLTRGFFIGDLDRLSISDRIAIF